MGAIPWHGLTNSGSPTLCRHRMLTHHAVMIRRHQLEVISFAGRLDLFWLISHLESSAFPKPQHRSQMACDALLMPCLRLRPCKAAQVWTQFQEARPAHKIVPGASLDCQAKATMAGLIRAYLGSKYPVGGLRMMWLPKVCWRQTCCPASQTAYA